MKMVREKQCIFMNYQEYTKLQNRDKSKCYTIWFWFSSLIKWYTWIKQSWGLRFFSSSGICRNIKTCWWCKEVTLAGDTIKGKRFSLLKVPLKRITIIYVLLLHERTKMVGLMWLIMQMSTSSARKVKKLSFMPSIFSLEGNICNNVMVLETTLLCQHNSKKAISKAESNLMRFYFLSPLWQS